MPKKTRLQRYRVKSRMKSIVFLWFSSNEIRSSSLLYFWQTVRTREHCDSRNPYYPYCDLFVTQTGHIGHPRSPCRGLSARPASAHGFDDLHAVLRLNQTVLKPSLTSTIAWKLWTVLTCFNLCGPVSSSLIHMFIRCHPFSCFPINLCRPQV